MISVHKEYDKPPHLLLSIRNKAGLKKTIEEEKDNWKANDYAPKVVKEKLEEIYNHKCAYCERTKAQGIALQVEHYRPKGKLEKRIIDNNGKEKVIIDTTHKGYYWLGIEWSNLLLACSDCNGKAGKRNLFPVQGIRVYNPQNPFTAPNTFHRKTLKTNEFPLVLERPLLLNPEFTKVESHFRFDMEAKMHGNTTEGIETIKICDLNRGILVQNRQKIRDDILELIETPLAAKRENLLIEGDNVFRFLFKRAFAKLEALQSLKNPYILWATHLFLYFDKCLLAAIDNPIEKKIIQNAFNLYKKGKL